MIILTAIALVLGWQWRIAKLNAIASSESKSALLTEQADSESQLARLKSEKERLQTELEKCQVALKQAEARPIVALSDVHISDMKLRGLKDPVADLLSNLEQRTDLIPFEGTLGGKMRFQPWLVNRYWVVAGAGDGHVGGWVALKYTIQNGQVNWTVLDFAKE